MDLQNAYPYPSNGDMQNYRLTLAYDGREFMGWQRHGDQRTVQGVLEASIESTFAQRLSVQGPWTKPPGEP